MSGGRIITETNEVGETLALGRLLGRCVRAGQVIALVGPLGAGKTCLVKGVAAGLGLEGRRRVVSPTYLIVKEYEARLRIYHVDAYRLAGPDDLEALGFEEMCEAGGVVLVEWADRVSSVMPEDHLRITIEPAGETQRRIFFEALGEQSAVLASRLEQI
jgi:tRNA threonylcarbamoyladenosine biosynthesis protein TsaE